MNDSIRREHFNRLAAEVYEPLQRYVRRRIGAGVVDDIVSETMLTLWRRIDEVPAGAVLPWAYAVARRHLANHRRSEGRRLRLIDRIASEPLSPVNTEGHPDAELDLALASLRPDDRELVRLWAWEQLEPAEIAVVLGISPNAASVRLHRVRRRLEEKLVKARKDEALCGHSPGDRKEERP